MLLEGYQFSNLFLTVLPTLASHISNRSLHVRAMSGSLKRHPSAEPEESPKAKRHTSADGDAPAAKRLAPETETAKIPEERVEELPSFLQPPTKVGGFSITDKAKITDDKATTNGNSNSIMNSGFKLSTGASLFSNGKLGKLQPPLYYYSNS